MLGRPRLALLLALTFAASAFAGCFAGEVADPASDDADATRPLDGLTEPVLAFGDFLALKIPSHDGVELHVDVQLPEGDGPFPTLIEYTPYSLLGEQAWGAVYENGLEGTVAQDNALANYYVPRGYAVGVAHVRGTGESGGCLTVGGPDEGKDGYAIVEGLAEMPWSNGRIALMGTSYVGTTPIETAILDPPHLATIIPISAVTSWYKYYFENGEQRMNGSPPPGASYPDPAFWLAMGVVPGVRTGAADPMDAACPAEMLQNFWLQDDYNDYWTTRDHGAFASQIRAPMLFVQGFDDENVATNMITDFVANVTSEKRVWLQQHAHGIPASFEAYYAYQHRWLDHFMLDKQNGALELPGVIVQDNRGQYRAESSWPPADAQLQRLWLGSGGALDNATPAETGSASFLDDGALPGVGDPAPASEIGSELRFVTEPLAQPMHLAGDARMHLVAASDMTDTQFSVILYDVAPDGSESFVTRGYIDARHRDSLQTGEDLVPGQAYVFEWLLHPRDHVLEAGHALALVVKSSDPYIMPDELRATNTVHFGAEGSWIELPLIDDAARAYSDAAPVPATYG